VKIVSAAFVLSAAHASDCPLGEQPELAVSGRSNVGKSSLLNALLGRRALAKVSNTPGKTRRLDFFLVNDAFHLVDLPGYGFAKASARARNEWSDMMQEYLQSRRQCVGILQAVDIRHSPSKEDREMVRWLREEQMPFCLIATKADKLAPTKRGPALRAIARELELPATQPMTLWSSETGEGRAELLAWVASALADAQG